VVPTLGVRVADPHTHTLDAPFIRQTVEVSLTAWRASERVTRLRRLTVSVVHTGSDHVVTADVGVAQQRWRTGALLLVVVHDTGRVRTACCRRRAQVYTFAVDASLVQRAAVVTAAADRAHEVFTDFSATAVVFFATQGFADTRNRVTLLVAEAAGRGGAGGATHRVLTPISLATISITRTWRCRSSHTRHLSRRVGHQPCAAGTGCTVVGTGAHCVRSTGVVCARVGTPVVPTSLTGRAVLVRVTAEDTHVVQTNVAEETVVIHPACQYAASFEAFFIKRTIVISLAHGATHVVGTVVSLRTLHVR